MVQFVPTSKDRRYTFIDIYTIFYSAFPVSNQSRINSDYIGILSYPTYCILSFPVLIDHSYISNNSMGDQVNGRGGGINLAYADLYLVRATITNNSAPDGGGISRYPSSLLHTELNCWFSLYLYLYLSISIPISITISLSISIGVYCDHSRIAFDRSSIYSNQFSDFSCDNGNCDISTFDPQWLTFNPCISCQRDLCSVCDGILPKRYLYIHRLLPLPSSSPSSFD